MIYKIKIARKFKINISYFDSHTSETHIQPKKHCPRTSNKNKNK